MNYTIDVEGTPYYLIPTGLHTPVDGEVYVAVCHEHEIVFPVAIHDTFISDIMDGREQCHAGAQNGATTVGGGLRAGPGVMPR